MPEKIFVIGHKSPDLDSISAAIAYADFKNKQTETQDYRPAVAGKINQSSEQILNKFNLTKPEILENVSGKNLILVDHNEASQSADGIGEAVIIEILDHHKLNFTYDAPIEVCIKPWGSSCSLIAQKYLDSGIAIEKPMAGLLLSAILDDTVITKSPTCTDKDKELIAKLAVIADIPDWQTYGLEMFKSKSNVGALSDIELIKNDFKDFNLKSGKFGIGQVESVDLSEFKEREDSLLKEMEKMRAEQNYHSVILFLTDIINEGSRFLIASGDNEKIAEALSAKPENNRVYIPGIMSRKKQVAPMFTKIFD
jgi:manganese-dependent inorganic pyrophosphatase